MALYNIIYLFICVLMYLVNYLIDLFVYLVMFMVVFIKFYPNLIKHHHEGSKDSQKTWLKLKQRKTHWDHKRLRHSEFLLGAHTSTCASCAFTSKPLFSSSITSCPSKVFPNGARQMASPTEISEVCGCLEMEISCFGRFYGSESQ